MHVALFERRGSGFMLSGLSGCVTTQQQPDGSTKVKVSLADVLGPKTQPQTAVTVPATAAASTEPKPNTALPPSIRTGALAGLFAKHPYDGTANRLRKYPTGTASLLSQGIVFR